MNDYILNFSSRELNQEYVSQLLNQEYVSQLSSELVFKLDNNWGQLRIMSDVIDLIINWVNDEEEKTSE